MKIYLALIRVVLFCVTLTLLVIGGLFIMQNWEGGKLMLGIGVTLSAIILIDLLRTKKVF
ncbi:hypothetical protein [Dyadobacter sp. NIV53]|uniref:hypothetical protein n=1 Tax=Dyadobacter sp. NIV53 TaxID=2861765 RepID=UPI001C8702B9|nr:hypothetical protein [Dyadobacter sp. NIV53]